MKQHIDFPSLIQRIAEQYGVSPEEVQHGMEQAVEETFANPSTSMRDALFPFHHTPDVSEFISRVADDYWDKEAG